MRAVVAYVLQHMQGAQRRAQTGADMSEQNERAQSRHDRSTLRTPDEELDMLARSLTREHVLHTYKSLTDTVHALLDHPEWRVKLQMLEGGNREAVVSSLPLTLSDLDLLAHAFQEIIRRQAVLLPDELAAEVLNSIKATFVRNEEWYDDNVSVQASEGGHVTLSGSVTTRAERPMAEEVAWRTHGVTAVTDNITVEVP